MTDNDARAARRGALTGGARRLALVALSAAGTVLAGCGPLQKFDPAPEHLETAVPRDGIPATVTQPPLPPPPVSAPRQETYSVVVTDVPVRDVLFALARDAGINVDISGDIQGNVTMNAIDQTLPQILDRISRQVSLRYELGQGGIAITPDVPFWRNYRIDYVNLARGSEGEVTVATQVATTGQGGVDGEGGGSEGSGSGGESELGNISRTTVKSVSDNSFWAVVTANVRQLVTGRAAAAEGGTGAEGTDPVVANPIAGVLGVNATQAQHAQVQAFIDEVAVNSKRQVLIEVTVVEVNLSDEYQAGVDWASVSSDGGLGSDGVSFVSEMLGDALGAPPVFTMTYNNFDADGSGFSAAVKMLQQFGNTKVLSSPRIMALNNQTALLKVVDERVYFSLEQETIEGTDNNNPRTIVTSEIRTVPVGFVMSVTPQINVNGNVSLNVRPTITRILGFVTDPAPQLIDSDVEFENLVPEIHVNEIESLLEVADGQTVVIGGLMTDEVRKNSDEIPLLGRLPGLGNLFKYRDDAVTKSELVLFLRPTVIRGAGVGDSRIARASLPTSLGGLGAATAGQTIP
jgi:general secretion pathway protein D